jgi:TetR/AcrR family transcriptional repressor of nem operon
MRKSKQETAQTREEILQQAARAFRKDGIAQTGIAEVMAAAGLTNGGFYRHFDSKEQLVAEACNIACSVLLDNMERRALGKTPEKALNDLVKHYLSPGHRDNFDNACPLAALGGELRHADEETRQAAGAGLDRFISIVASQLEQLSSEKARARATAVVSAMVGSMVLARIVNNRSMSNAILKDTAQFILRCEQTERSGGSS